ncbi:serine-rich adhesin for platelets-like [Mytilus californianus]|uniref:serine-rich adhesin for platelets-like n=1 Tax=Mytilus californianus TaxID=6549 RepID=UPI002247C376|nr:serine-rich adhesin for platelets-like [Mytilus californianus]
MKFFSIVFVLWIPNISCLLRWSSDDNVEYREEIPVEISQGQRTRRSADDSFHPQTYDLDLKVEGSQVHFHLVRNDDIKTNVPTLSLSQGTLTDIYLQEQKESIFYQDIKKGASFVVQQDKKQSESMFGTFNSGGDSFILQSPKERLSSLLSGSNTFELIKEIRNRTEFGDGLQSDDRFESLPVRKHHRQKRATGSNQIELLIFCDYAIYDYWYNQSEASAPSEKETEALTSVRQYYAFVLNGMDAMYKNIQTSDYTISVLFAGIVISQTQDEAPWTESIKDTTVTPNTVDSLQGLNKFSDWIQANSSHLPERDHSMLFTRYDLTRDGSNSNLGLAWTGAICGTFSQSIVEDGFNFIIITVATHELGHSLSAKHDGTSNVCSSTDAFIMAPSSGPQQDSNKAGNPWIFSTCSTAYFTSQINTLESSGSNCLKTLGSNFDPTALAPYDQSLAGLVNDADAQCVHIYGNNSYMSRNLYSGNFESICSLLWCYNPAIARFSGVIAGEGTLCGNNKWCVSGLCTSDSNAPSGNENCLYGDKRGRIFSNQDWTCADMYAIAPYNCAVVPVDCCATCNPETTTDAPSTETQTTTSQPQTSTEYLTTTESVTIKEHRTTIESVITTESLTTIESVTTTEPLTTTESVTTTEPMTTTHSVTTTELMTTTESVTTKEPLTSTESVTTTAPQTTTESVTTTEPLTTTESVTTTEPLTTTESVTTTEPLTTPTEFITIPEPLTTTETVTLTEPLTTSESITTTEPLTTTESITTTEPLTTTESITITEPLTTTESVTTTAPLTTESVTATKPLTTTESTTTIEPVTTTESVTTKKPLTTTESVTATEPLTTTVPVTITEPMTTTESITTTEPVTTAESVTTTTIESGQFEASVTMDKTWNPAYANSSSTEYLDLHKNFTKQLTNMYENTTIRDDIQNLTITGFRNGSVIADYMIELKPGTTESETTITNITKQAVENIKSNPSPEFDLIKLINTDKIVVEEAIAKTTYGMTSQPDETTQSTTQSVETTDNLESLIIGISAVSGVIILGFGTCIIICCMRLKKSSENEDKTNKG